MNGSSLRRWKSFSNYPFDEESVIHFQNSLGSHRVGANHFRDEGSSRRLKSIFCVVTAQHREMLASFPTMGGVSRINTFN
jgi:hypothetical protein